MNSTLPTPEFIERISKSVDVLSDGPDFTERLTQWLAEVRSDEAIGARRRESWLRRQAAEEASWAGLLADVCERAVPVVLHLTTGRRHSGTITAVGADVVVVARPSGRQLLVGAAWIDSLVVADPHPFLGDRRLESDFALHGALELLAAERARLVMRTAGGETVAGTLEAVGFDVAVIRVDNAEAVAYVNLAMVTEVTEA